MAASEFDSALDLLISIGSCSERQGAQHIYNIGRAESEDIDGHSALTLRSGAAETATYDDRGRLTAVKSSYRCVLIRACGYLQDLSEWAIVDSNH